jgi:serine/threonine-protein kinase
VFSGRRPEGSGRTTVLPGMGSGPTGVVAGGLPPVDRVRPGIRPGLPEHIHRRRGRLAVAVILLLAITIGVVGWWMGSGRWVEVPQVAGEPQARAIGHIQERNLDPVCCTEEFDETVAAGIVLRTEPADGQAVMGSDVTLVVSKGPETFQVDPELEGRPVDEVQAALESAGIPITLDTTSATDYSATVPQGSVISFDPPAGSDMRRDTTVTAVVSLGRAPVEVPDLVGDDPDAAAAALADAGFEVERDTGRSADVDTGEVMAVTPGVGTPAPYGSTVTITVSDGLPRVTVPDVGGMSEAEATSALEAAGLRVEVSTFLTGDRVYQQEPDAGATVDQGSTVDLLLSIG